MGLDLGFVVLSMAIATIARSRPAVNTSRDFSAGCPRQQGIPAALIAESGDSSRGIVANSRCL
jgi:hypothetical protein